VEGGKNMAHSYENLKVWQDSIELASLVYALSKTFPKEEQFGLVSQIRRAAVSVSSNIAEGSSRKSKKDYTRFLDIAIGSLNEVESLLHIAIRLQFVSQAQSQPLIDIILSLGNSLGAFRKYLQK